MIIQIHIQCMHSILAHVVFDETYSHSTISQDILDALDKQIASFEEAVCASSVVMTYEGKHRPLKVLEKKGLTLPRLCS